ncbi:uncharacterized protein LOC144425776 [Styela clava]
MASNDDPNTRDILTDVRNADRAGERENLFYLYVATPKRPPSALHKKVIRPFLISKGWRKVSYERTGFRALYFLRRRQETTPTVEQHSNRDQSSSEVIIITDSDAEDGPSSSQSRRPRLRRNTQIPIAINATQIATDHRTELKQVIENYRIQHDLTFDVHIVLSRPIDYEVDFAGLAS